MRRLLAAGGLWSHADFLNGLSFSLAAVGWTRVPGPEEDPLLRQGAGVHPKLAGPAGGDT